MTGLHLKGLSKYYGDMCVLHPLDLHIEAGEFVVVVGPSGCGKSTLLRMIAGLESITDGELWLGDQCINHVLPKDRNMAMVFQNYALYPHMTVYKNMAYALKQRGLARAAIHKKVLSVAKRLQIESYLQAKPNQLSGGQRQRVAMGRAMVRDPSVFLFDEPLSNLDATLRVHLRRELKSLHQSLKTTSLYVTHDQTEAMTLGDKLVVLSDGHIQQVGTPLHLYKHPANTFVAQFIGSPNMNLLTGRLNATREAFEFETQMIPGTYRLDLPETFILGFRPEHCRLAEVHEPGLQVEVLDIERHGGYNCIYLKAQSLKAPLACIQSVETALPQLNTCYSLQWQPEHLHYFDVEGVAL